jgi:hypothetical protein
MAANANLWHVQVLTPDYSVSGDYDSRSGGRGSFFEAGAVNAYRDAPVSLKLTNASFQTTGALQGPSGLGSTYLLSTQNSFIAVIPRSEDAVSYVLQHSKTRNSLPAVALVGPYAIQGLFATNEATLDMLAGNRLLVVQDARIDCLTAGSGFQNVKVECALVYTLHLQGLWPSA